jgi:ATP-dependent Clp protease ATP-binding subunit ClpC
MVRIDCGEFQHKHENQKLIGSPPGYVGHDEGGQLVNLVKKNPYTVVLLDEVEKAHPDLWNTFLRVFDDGILTDSKGEEVDFRNTIIIMTTNLGNEKTVDFLLAGGAGFNKSINYKAGTTQAPPKEMVEKNTLDAIRKHFRPEFLNRIDKTIVFNHLIQDDFEKIAELEMSIVADKLVKKGYLVNYNEQVISAMLKKGVDTVKGARGLAQVRREQVEDKLADILIKSLPPRGSIFEISYKDKEDDFIFTIKKPEKETNIEI